MPLAYPWDPVLPPGFTPWSPENHFFITLE